MKAERSGLRWRLDQIVGVKDAARSLPRLIARQESVVLARRGEPQAVLVPIAEYERLWAVNDATTNGRTESTWQPPILPREAHNG